MGREDYSPEFPGKKLDKGRSGHFAEEAVRNGKNRQKAWQWKTEARTPGPKIVAS